MLLACTVFQSEKHIYYEIPSTIYNLQNKRSEVEKQFFFNFIKLKIL